MFVFLLNKFFNFNLIFIWIFSTLPAGTAWLKYISQFYYGTEALSIVQWKDIRNISKQNTNYNCAKLKKKKPIEIYNFTIFRLSNRSIGTMHIKRSGCFKKLWVQVRPLPDRLFRTASNFRRLSFRWVFGHAIQESKRTCLLIPKK